MTGAAHDRAAAASRVDEFFDGLSRIDRTAFVQTALPTERGADALTAARVDAERLAQAAGLDDVLADARTRAGSHVLRLYDEELYRPTMVGLNWGLSEGRTADRVAAARAVEDAASAAVIEPMASPALLATLSSRYELIERGGAVDTSFDLTRSTARALDMTTPGRGPGRAIALGIVIVAAVSIAVASGSWAVVGLGVALIALVARLTRSASDPS